VIWRRDPPRERQHSLVANPSDLPRRSNWQQRPGNAAPRTTNCLLVNDPQRSALSLTRTIHCHHRRTPPRCFFRGGVFLRSPSLPYSAIAFSCHNRVALFGRSRYFTCSNFFLFKLSQSRFVGYRSAPPGLPRFVPMVPLCDHPIHSENTRGIAYSVPSSSHPQRVPLRPVSASGFASTRSMGNRAPIGGQAFALCVP